MFLSAFLQLYRAIASQIQAARRRTAFSRLRNRAIWSRLPASTAMSLSRSCGDFQRNAPQNAMCSGTLGASTTVSHLSDLEANHVGLVEARR
jgi:hypothetical protein